jgi:hypothetical protein
MSTFQIVSSYRLGGVTTMDDTSRLFEEQPKREDSVLSLPKKQRKKPKSHELCMAAQAGNIQEVKRLLHKGEDPSKGDYDDRTPLHMAAAGMHYHFLLIYLSLVDTYFLLIYLFHPRRILRYSQNFV